MLRFGFLIFCVFLFVDAQQYPKTFQTLATPLYKSCEHLQEISSSNEFYTSFQTYKSQLQTLKHLGFEVDVTKDKKLRKEYLYKLRLAQKKYEYLLHLLREEIIDTIKKKDYGRFLLLVELPLDELLEKRVIKEKALTFYKQNRSKQKSRVMEAKLEDIVSLQNAQEIFTEVKEVAYTSDTTQKQPSTTVTLQTKRKGRELFVTFTNHNSYDITLEVMPRYTNVTESSQTQRIIVVHAKETKLYTTLSLKKGKISYGYRYRWIMGNKDAKHQDDYLYRLPYKKGSAYMVSQGFNGTSTHKGRSRYAVDFSMPESTQIYAAREGVVVKTKADSTQHGFSKRFASFGNFITIQHDDGTMATYYHLKKNGVVVSVGSLVKRGELIGYSGNTGYSSGPHLHFAVFKATEKLTTQSLPIKFISARGVITNPITRMKYRAK